MGLGVEIEIVGRSIQLRLVPEINSRREDLQGNLAFTVLPRGMIGGIYPVDPGDFVSTVGRTGINSAGMNIEAQLKLSSNLLVSTK